MQIGVDVSRTAEPKSGLHSYARSLLAALARIDRHNEYRLHPVVSQCVPLDHKRAFCPWARNFKLYGRWSPRGRLQRRWAAHPDRDHFFADDPDVYFSPFHFVPERHYRRLVCVYHDISWQVHPEFSTDENRELCAANFERARRRADRIITVSHHAKSEMVKHMGIPEHTIAAIPLAAAPIYRPLTGARIPRRIRRDFGEPAQWILFVGSIEPRKNLTTLIRAYDQLLQHGRCQPRLMIAGGPGWKNAQIYEEIAARGLVDRVHFVGQASDAELLQLYNCATAVVCPSIYEGFGLPLIEALSCGAPVVATHVTSYPEVAGNAALFVEDPLDVTGFTRHLERLMHEPELRADLRARGIAQAARFSWERCARETLAVLEEVHSGTQFRRERLEFGRDERAAVSGWHETEQDHGTHYRWTSGRATARLVARPGALVVHAACGIDGQVLEVRAQGRPIGTCQLQPTWQEFRLPTNGTLARDHDVEIELRVDVLVPDARKPGDTRTLGARVRSVEFQQA